MVSTPSLTLKQQLKLYEPGSFEAQRFIYRAVADAIENSPEMYRQREYGDTYYGTDARSKLENQFECVTPQCIAGWICTLFGEGQYRDFNDVAIEILCGVEDGYSHYIPGLFASEWPILWLFGRKSASSVEGRFVPSAKDAVVLLRAAADNEELMEKTISDGLDTGDR